MDDYISYDAVGLAELLRQREVAPQELLEAACRRRDEVNPRVNAVVMDFDPPASQLEQARPWAARRPPL